MTAVDIGLWIALAFCLASWFGERLRANDWKSNYERLYRLLESSQKWQRDLAEKVSRLFSEHGEGWRGDYEPGRPELDEDEDGEEWKRG